MQKNRLLKLNSFFLLESQNCQLKLDEKKQ